MTVTSGSGIASKAIPSCVEPVSLRPFVRLALASATCFALFAAIGERSHAQAMLTFGRAAPTEPLLRLKGGISTKADVRAALGEPRGGGFARHSSREKIREIWFYEYIQVRGEHVGLKIALVFFRNDRYDGHLWFAAKDLVAINQP